MQISALVVVLVVSMGATVFSIPISDPKVETLRANALSKIPMVDDEDIARILHDFFSEIESVSAQSRAGPSTKGNADDYVDKLLVNLRKVLQEKYDPLEAADLGEILYLELKGLTSIYRSGSANLLLATGGLRLDANFGFQKLHGEAYVEKQLFWFIWISGKVTVDIKGLNVYGKIKVGLNNGVKPELELLDFTDWGHIEATISEGNWVGTVASWINGVFPSLVNNFLKSNLPDMVRTAVKNILDNADFEFPLSR